MQELTIILFVASLAMGALAMSIRKPQTGTYVLSTVLSVLAIAAVLTDEAVMTSEGFDATLMIVAPFIMFVWSLVSWLFGRSK